MNVWEDLLPSLGRRKERVGGEPTRGRYCGGAVALKKTGGSAFPLPPDLRGWPLAPPPPSDGGVEESGVSRCGNRQPAGAGSLFYIGRRGDNHFALCIQHFAFIRYAAVAQMEEHHPPKVGVAGSSPVCRSNRFLEYLLQGVNCA